MLIIKDGLVSVEIISKSSNCVSFQIWSNFCLRNIHLRGHVDSARASERGRYQPQPENRIHGTKFIQNQSSYSRCKKYFFSPEEVIAIIMLGERRKAHSIFLTTFSHPQLKMISGPCCAVSAP